MKVSVIFHNQTGMMHHNGKKESAINGVNFHLANPNSNHVIAITIDGNSFEETFKEDGSSSSHRPQSKQQHFREPYVVFIERRAQEIRGKIEEYDGWGTALKPAYEGQSL